MAAAGPGDWYNGLPPGTRALGTAMVLAAAGVQLGLGFNDYLNEFRMGSVIAMRGDSQAALALAPQGGTWKRRHYTVEAGALRQAVRLSSINMQPAQSSEQRADALTKLPPGSAMRRIERFSFW